MDVRKTPFLASIVGIEVAVLFRDAAKSANLYLVNAV